ncbi:hypothetical protein VCR4J5_1510231 [Vibrio crassostreae]|uniref:Uncharacterized protein n=1 Tax=Vibrio crassostreae TaxID=246167 RepID=A0A4R3PAJ4_9VIBR|nr:hypothetical protein [Vibrio crassostreae]MDH5950296.1 hypothetical protein [Vibrio crassostreae]ROS70538.1 hypothetical protein EDB73_101214 [Vibrio crassostreae]RPF18564.1 hypothetical protein EDB12_1555 [Vibrio crassostreae]TCL30582.1 hypothetical protein EDB52_101869 [Vibrio crassostreae]TCN06591.1 hypothetical protein EDB35_11288 [Vibrio crassostreae]
MNQGIFKNLKLALGVGLGVAIHQYFLSRIVRLISIDQLWRLGLRLSLAVLVHF